MVRMELKEPGRSNVGCDGDAEPDPELAAEDKAPLADDVDDCATALVAMKAQRAVVTRSITLLWMRLCVTVVKKKQ